VSEAVHLAAAPLEEPEVHGVHLDSGRGQARFAVERPLAGEAPGWAPPIRAGLAAARAMHRGGPTGLAVCIASDLPGDAGFAAPTALAVASALAFPADADSLSDAATRVRWAEAIATAQAGADREAGGMDAAIILCAEDGCATKVNFRPIRLEHVPLFPDHAILLCDAAVPAEKAAARRADAARNAGLGRLIRALVEAEARRAWDEDIELESLADLWEGHLCLTHAEVSELLDAALPPEGLTLRAAAERLGLTEAEVRRHFTPDLAGDPAALPLRARGRHVQTEAARVEAGRDALLADDPAAFGRLMAESHRSRTGDYGITCPEADALVRIAMEAGAHGARMAGADASGTVVCLVPREGVRATVDRLHAGYYQRWLGLAAPPQGAVREVQPSAGAARARAG
jgi:galactokinase